jgi:hypothetical protein
MAFSVSDMAFFATGDQKFCWPKRLEKSPKTSRNVHNLRMIMEV